MKPLNHNRRHAFTLVELMIVVVVIGVMAAMAVPSYKLAIEQSKSDLAIANLRAVWAAQRLYWVENRTYAATVKVLQDSSLLTADINTSDPTKDYVYAIATSSTNAFSATATRQNGVGWTGYFTVNQDGSIGGYISKGTSTINPPYMYR